MNVVLCRLGTIKTQIMSSTAHLQKKNSFFFFDFFFGFYGETFSSIDLPHLSPYQITRQMLSWLLAKLLRFTCRLLQLLLRFIHWPAAVLVTDTSENAPGHFSSTVTVGTPVPLRKVTAESKNSLSPPDITEKFPQRRGAVELFLLKILVGSDRLHAHTVSHPLVGKHFASGGSLRPDDAQPREGLLKAHRWIHGGESLGPRCICLGSKQHCLLSGVHRPSTRHDQGRLQRLILLLVRRLRRQCRRKPPDLGRRGLGHNFVITAETFGLSTLLLFSLLHESEFVFRSCIDTASSALCVQDVTRCMEQRVAPRRTYEIRRHLVRAANVVIKIKTRWTLEVPAQSDGNKMFIHEGYRVVADSTRAIVQSMI